MRHAGWLLGLLLLLAAPDRVSAQTRVVVDGATRHQTMDGFGISLPAAAPLLPDRDALRRLYFQDLGTSLLRVDLHVNALQAARGDLTTPVVLGSDLRANVARFDFDEPHVAAAGEMAAAGAALKRDQFRLVGSISSPPHWMKGPERTWYDGTYVDADPRTAGVQHKQPVVQRNRSLGGTLRDTPANLAQFARYVAAYVVGFEQRYGVPFYALSFQNGPFFSEAHNSAVYFPELYVETLKAVQAEFDRHGIRTKLLGPEGVGLRGTGNPWPLWRQFQFIEAVRADPEAFAALDLYALHGRAHGGVLAGGATAGQGLWRQYREGRARAHHPDPAGAWWSGIRRHEKPTWVTRADEGPPAWLHPSRQGTLGALALAVRMHEALVFGNAGAYFHGALQGNGSDPLHPPLLPGSDVAGKPYHAAKHFYRYVRPGAVRIDTAPASQAGLHASAFVQDEQGTLTVVLINTTGSEETVQLLLSETPSVASFDVYGTSAERDFAAGPAASFHEDVVSVALPAYSVVTLHGRQAEEAASLAARVAAGSEDAEAWAGGATNLYSSDLDLGKHFSALRFPLNVPQGARIETAALQFTADEAQEGPTHLTLHAEAADDAAPLTRGVLTGRARSDARATWVVPAWARGTRGPAQRSPDLATLVQETVDREGWQSGNHLVLLIDGLGKRSAQAYEAGPAQAPALHVTYRTETPSGIVPLAASGSPLDLPREIVLEGNYPNPFEEKTTIRYALPAATHVTLKVYDVLGREVMTLVDGMDAPGTHLVPFDGSHLASGLYICRLKVGRQHWTQKMTLIR